MSNGKVNCPACKENVSPRLWHSNNNSFLFKRSTEHICPLCGTTMYTSGGGLSLGAKILIGIFVVLPLLQFIARPLYLILPPVVSDLIVICLVVYLFFWWKKKKEISQNDNV